MTNVTQLDLFTISFLQGGEISKDLQVEFLDNLLSTYQELETSFMREVYELHKAFRFRTLWEGTNPLSLYQRVAVESAHGVGRLNGILEMSFEISNRPKRKLSSALLTTFILLIFRNGVLTKLATKG